MKKHKNNTITSREFSIFCFSDMQDKFVPSLWPNTLSEGEAETFAREHIKHTRYEVRPVTVTKSVPFTLPAPRLTVDQRLRGLLIGQRLPFQIRNAKTGEVLAPANQRLQRFHTKRLLQNRTHLELPVHAASAAIKRILG